MQLDVTERRLARLRGRGPRQERMRAWAVIRGAYLGADENEERVLRALVGVKTSATMALSRRPAEPVTSELAGG